MTEETKKVETKTAEKPKKSTSNKEKTTSSVSILTQIQNELNAPKSQYNSFGKYHYRSVEDIVEAVKPLLYKHNATLILTDKPVLIGDRQYIEATALYQDAECSREVTGYARESVNKKGMDDSQLTGATSSYARKYALNGLFLIDDAKDADTDEYRQQNNRRQSTNYSKPKHKAVANLSLYELSNYPINVHGTDTVMSILVKQIEKKNKRAIEFSNTLKGRDMEVFQELIKRQ